MKFLVLVAASLATFAFQVVGPARAAADKSAGTTIVAVGPTDSQECIWKRIKGLPCT